MKKQHDTNDSEALDRFIVENDELLELEELVGRFNIFDALRIDRAEIRHSYFLAWLLNPNESHGQGALFLRAFLMDVLRTADSNQRPLSPVELDGVELRNVQILRERHNIDLLILSEHPNFAVVVENKIDSSEHSDQLRRYEDLVHQIYPHKKAFFVYLTPNGIEPSRDKWNAYSYARLHAVFLRLRRISQKTIGDEVAVFLEHYLNLIGTRFMENAEIDVLCKRIWENHHRALRLIFERYGSPDASIGVEIQKLSKISPTNGMFFLEMLVYPATFNGTYQGRVAFTMV